MHVLIINGSPRVQKYSNTDKIIDSFAEGLTESGVSFEKHVISVKPGWDAVRDAYCRCEEIIIALPVFVECVPGLLLEFLETLPRKDKNTRLSFIIQGGFAEASQMRCCEAFVKQLPEQLGVSYGGTLIKGDNFGIRVVGPEDVIKITGPYREMGRAFVRENGFRTESVNRFAGPEYLSLPMRIMLQVMFRTIARKKFEEAAAKAFGCNTPLDYQPWQTDAR